MGPPPGMRGLVEGRGWSGHATHKRFSSPRPRKAPGCTVLMTLLLRSLRETSGGALTPWGGGHTARLGGQPPP